MCCWLGCPLLLVPIIHVPEEEAGRVRAERDGAVRDLIRLLAHAQRERLAGVRLAAIAPGACAVVGANAEAPLVAAFADAAELAPDRPSAGGLLLRVEHFASAELILVVNPRVATCKPNASDREAGAVAPT